MDTMKIVSAKIVHLQNLALHGTSSVMQCHVYYIVCIGVTQTNSEVFDYGSVGTWLCEPAFLDDICV